MVAGVARKAERYITGNMDIEGVENHLEDIVLGLAGNLAGGRLG